MYFFYLQGQAVQPSSTAWPCTTMLWKHQEPITPKHSIAS